MPGILATRKLDFPWAHAKSSTQSAPFNKGPLGGCGSLFLCSLFLFRVLSSIKLPRFRERFRTTGIGGPQKFATKNRAFLLCFYLLKKPYTRRCAVCTAGMPAASSGQMALRHTRQSTYCCFRQDLTGFMAENCTGPGRQHTHFCRAAKPRTGCDFLIIQHSRWLCKGKTKDFFTFRIIQKNSCKPSGKMI